MGLVTPLTGGGTNVHTVTDDAASVGAMSHVMTVVAVMVDVTKMVVRGSSGGLVGLVVVMGRVVVGLLVVVTSVEVVVVVVVVVCRVVVGLVISAVEVGVGLLVGRLLVMVMLSEVVGCWRVGVVLAGLVAVSSLVGDSLVGSVVGGRVFIGLVAEGSGVVGSRVPGGSAVGASPPLPESLTSESKTSFGILAALRSWEKLPLPSWYAKALVLLDGVVTASEPLAQASLLAPLGSSDAPSHSLQPVQSTSSCQCVALVTEVGRTWYVAPS